MKTFGRWVRFKSVQAVGLGLASALLVLGALHLGWFETIENKSLDWRFRTFSAQARAGSDIVIVALDDSSFAAPGMIENFGRWPWRRQLYGLLIHYLHECGAKVIGVDITFEGKDANAGDDELFAQALNEKRDVVLALGMNLSAWHFTDPAASRALEKRLEPFAWKVEKKTTLSFVNYTGVDLSQDMFVKASAGLGSVAIQPDADGPTRKLVPIHRFGNQLFPAFSLAIASKFMEQAPGAVVDAGPTLVASSRRVPLDPEGHMLIRWYGGQHTYPYYSVWKVFNSALAVESGEKPEIPSDTFRNKIVLIGPTATGISDLHPNPFSPIYPGVEVHATVIDNFLQNDFMRETGQRTRIVAVFGMALLIAGAVYAFSSATVYSLASVLIGVLYFVAVCFLFDSRNLWAPMVAPLSAGGTAFLSATLTRYATEGREKRQYRKTLMKYLSPSLVETIMSDMDWASLRAEKKTLTVLFSDVRGFTTFSEEYPPETVIATLNEHLNMMVSVIFKYQGTLDKFVGDCVMAFWGAPVEQPNQGDLAARAALEMIEGLEKLNQKWQSEGRPTLHIGVGINTGEMLFGNIGSEQRMDFTVIGDSVNLGARLESATKELKASIVISDSTYRLIQDLAEVRPLGEISVKGKAHKIVVYELLGMAAAPGEPSRLKLKEVAT
jgi:adenylate cyclase